MKKEDANAEKVWLVFVYACFNSWMYLRCFLFLQDYRARRFIDQKVEVVSGTTTDDYLRKLDEALEVASRNFQPELVIYNAGTDILDGDPLGRLKISPDGITSRDEKVFRFAREKNIPLVMLTSGGYMQSSARVIADSIENLSRQGLIQTRPE
ncbi:PREDICTED: histone deacetylase 2-like [Camelina sativa]|uniref:Histone deacetylase 2-like n=1 Tax=Camelina sativa TaxID=90675 RepID=A0ABM0VII1_CAMSA|nr:PREDICTED: histone deacetylase 2-like [Camelina sativa]